MPQAFAATALCFFLYLVLMGVILYTGSLLLGGIWGIVIAFIVHVSGFELPFSGHIGLALMEYACPGNFADSVSASCRNGVSSGRVSARVRAENGHCFYRELFAPV